MKELMKKYEWLFAAVGLLLTVGFSVALYKSHAYMQRHTMDTAVKSLKSAVRESFVMINDVQTAADTYVSLIEHKLDSADAMFDLSKQILQEHPMLKGCSISFEPYFFKEKGKYFSAYSYNRGDSIVTEQEGDDGYQYFCMDWYLIPRQLNKKYWIEPFSETNTDGIIVKEVMTSFCQPLYDSEGQTIGVLSVDVPLKALSDTILARHPFPQSYCMLLGRGGTYIVHPDSSRLLTESILTPTLEGEHPELMRLGRAMIAGETGQQGLLFDGVKSHVFYMPFGRTGWSLALVCQDFVLMKNFYMLAWLFVFFIILSISIMLIPLWNYRSEHRNKQLSTMLLLAMMLGIVSCSQAPSRQAQQQPGSDARKEMLRQARRQIIDMGYADDPRYFERLDSLAKVSDMTPQEADYWRADYYNDREKFRLAQMYLKKAVATDDWPKDASYQYYKAHNMLITINYNTNNVDEAISLATNAYQKACQDTSVMGQCWANNYLGLIGYGQRKLHHDKEATVTLNKARETALALAIAHPEDWGVHESCIIMAANNINTLLDRHEYDQITPWLNMMEQGLEGYAGTDASMETYDSYYGRMLKNKAISLYMSHHPDEAAAVYRDFLNTDYAKSYTGLYDQGSYMGITQQWEKQLKLLATADSLEKASGVTPSIDYLRETPASIFNALMETGRKDEALKKATEIIELLDSVMEYQHRSDAEELAVIYETQQKEEKIAHQEAELSQQRLFWMGIIFVAMVVFFIIFTIYRVRAAKRLSKIKAAQERIEGELQIARDIQMSMVPHDFPVRDGLDMYAAMTPAREVGGDLYGYVLKDDSLYFAIGDVSGKGVPASLFMAQATSLFQTLASQGMAPAEICTLMNNTLSGDNNESGMFVTFFLGVINLTTGHLSFCNAGHNPPVIGGDADHGNFLEMNANAPIGLWPGLEYEGEELETIKGRPLFFYTDGLNEAENSQQQQFGDEHLLDILRHTQFDSARQVIETLTAEVERHRNGADPNDDLTMMCIEVN